jgi:hypothetical protein
MNEYKAGDILPGGKYRLATPVEMGVVPVETAPDLEAPHLTYEYFKKLGQLGTNQIQRLV